MVDTKKAGAKSASKAPATVKSVAAAAKPKAKVAKSIQQAETNSVASTEPKPSVEAGAKVASVAAPALEMPKIKPAPVVIEKVEAAVVAVAAPVAASIEAVAPKGAALRQAMSEAVTASAHGALDINGKIIDALQTQGNAALDLWRSTVSTPHLPDVLRLQSSGARHAYETASAQWKDIAETTAHWFTKTVEPLSSAISDRKR